MCHPRLPVARQLFGWPGNYLASHPETTGFVQTFVVQPGWALGVAFILFGFGALTYAKHPEGIIEAQGSVAAARFARLFNRSGRQPESSPDAPPEGPAPEVPSSVDVVA